MKMKHEEKVIILTEKEFCMEVGILKKLLENIIDTDSTMLCNNMYENDDAGVYVENNINKSVSMVLRLLYRRIKRDGETFEDFVDRMVVGTGLVQIAE